MIPNPSNFEEDSENDSKDIDLLGGLVSVHP
jgi:hypothetical protein